jgi:hypothetical protein
MDEEVVIKALTQVKTSMTQGQKSFRRSLWHMLFNMV